MCLVFCMIPMTFWLVMAYVILYLQKRSEGRMRVFGRLLALWLIGLAACFLVFGAYIQFFTDCPVERRAIRLLSAPRGIPIDARTEPGKARPSF